MDGETAENRISMDLSPLRLRCAELSLVAVQNAVKDR